MAANQAPTSIPYKIGLPGNATLLVGSVILDLVQVIEDLRHGLGVLRKLLWIHASLDGQTFWLRI
jgi:hypothetical protein